MKHEAFLIPINAITESQILEIMKVSNENMWNFSVAEKCVYGYTFYEDQGTMYNFISNLYLNKKYIYWYDFLPDGIELDALNRQILQEQRRNKIINIER